jgi:hypothetical protein
MSAFVRPSDAPRRSLAIRRVVALALLLALAGCANGGPSDEASSAVLDPTTTTTDVVRPARTPEPVEVMPDTRSVVLAPVEGPSTTEPAVEILGGEASLSGSLVFLGEPVEGATVRLERWVGGHSAAIELTTGGGGGWLAEGIQGGRYVIRAWKGTSLTLAQASAVFLAEDEEREIHLPLVSVIVPEDDEDDDDEDDDAEDDGAEDGAAEDGDEAGTDAGDAGDGGEDGSDAAEVSGDGGGSDEGGDA